MPSVTGMKKKSSFSLHFIRFSVSLPSKRIFPLKKNKMEIRANCKINLGLNIVERRKDGYHNIETVFYPVPLADTLQVTPSEQDALLLEGVPVDGPTEDNLVMRVVRKLRQLYPIPPLHVVLRKNVPVGAGLGGGSSDAAHMLKLLNTEFRLGLSEQQMQDFLSPLGADCAFFVPNKPLFAEGIGNKFSPVAVRLDGWHLVLVKPEVAVSTREAYAGVTPHRPSVSLRQLITLPVEEWRQQISNDFEAGIFALHPIIRDVRDALYGLGATYAAMSGSGSCVYALFREAPQLGNTFSGHFVFSSTL